MAAAWSLGSALRGMFTRATIDDSTWDALEDALISADFGSDLTDAIVEELRDKVAKYRTTDPADLQPFFRNERIARIRKTTKQIFAIKAEVPATPPKPSTPAMRATTRKMIA